MGNQLKGAQAQAGKLRKLRKNVPDEVGRALYQEMSIEATEAQKRTPVNKGTLRGTVHVTEVEREGNRIWCKIVAGGPAAPYAVYVHENLEAFHKVGQAKFIESVILESRPFMAARIAKRIELNRALA